MNNKAIGYWVYPKILLGELSFYLIGLGAILLFIKLLFCL